TERTVVAIDHPSQYLRLTFGPVVIDRRGQLALGATHLAGKLRAFGDQFLDAAIDAIDALAQVGEIGTGLLQSSHQPCRPWKACMKSANACTPASGMAL